MIRGADPWYMAGFFVLIIVFTYFYVSITFNPDEVAENMRKAGGFIPRIRPGGPTAGYPPFLPKRPTPPCSLHPGHRAPIPLPAITPLPPGNHVPPRGPSIKYPGCC